MDGTTTDRVGAVDHDAWMALATTEYARLDDLLRSLTPAEWVAPTDCVEWDVRAMVAHLVGAAEGNARIIEGVRQAVVGRRRYRRDVLVDSINMVQIADRAGRTPAELVEDLRDAGRRGVAARRRIPGLIRGIVVPIGPPIGTKPIGYLMDRIYTRDAWMHRIDIARATGHDLVVTRTTTACSSPIWSRNGRRSTTSRSSSCSRDRRGSAAPAAPAASGSRSTRSSSRARPAVGRPTGSSGRPSVLIASPARPPTSLRSEGGPAPRQIRVGMKPEQPEPFVRLSAVIVNECFPLPRSPITAVRLSPGVTVGDV